MLQEIMELSDLRIHDIMIPRVDIVAYDIAGPADGLVEEFRRTHLRRIPVHEGDIDNILGVVHAKQLLLSPETPLRDLIVSVPFVPEAGIVERVLLQLMVTKSQMAIVVDEYGGTAGLVTLEDILEEVVGDIPDPHDLDRGPAVEQISDREYLLDGNLAIHEWTDAFKIDLSGQRISTIGGFVTSLLGKIPQTGESVTYRNLKFTVESMRHRRIGKIRLERLEGGS
jgi:putative hemolysin